MGRGTLGRLTFCSISTCSLGVLSQCPGLERGCLKRGTVGERGEGAERLSDPHALDGGVKKPHLGEVGVDIELFILKNFKHKEELEEEYHTHPCALHVDSTIFNCFPHLL